MKIRISKAYGEKNIFQNLELEIFNGEVTCILGASGVGKTTLLNVLAGLTPFDGELVGVPENVGYIFQEPRLLSNLTVTENLRYAGGRVALIDEILEKVGLAEHKNKRPKQLSGGEKQRVSIARAFLSDAPLLLLDEPFSSLDTALKIKLSQTFAKLWEEERRTAVMVTHDLEVALMIGHRILLLQEGKVALDLRLHHEKYPAPYGLDCKERGLILKTVLGE